MSPWAARTTKPIPSMSSQTKEFELNGYAKGFDSYTPDDDMPFSSGDDNRWRLAQDARMITRGQYETRKGFDFHSAAAGEAIDVQQTSVTGAADVAISQTKRIAKKLTFTQTGRVTRLDINLKDPATATGTILVELYSNDGGALGTLLDRTSIAASAIDGSYAYEISRLPAAPSVTATDYWCVAYVQATGSGEYNISSTTNATTGLVSTDSGVTWTAANVDFNVKAYLSTTGAAKGLHRAYKSDGTSVTLFVHGTVLYSVSDVTGALTSVKTGLSANATHYRFKTVNDIVYYVNGYDGYRKLTGASFGTDSQVSATNYTHIELHKGLMFLVTKDDPNKVVFSNFADYETFTSTDFFYANAPKTGDPVTAILSLNGYLFIWTKNNKYILFGTDNATFSLDEAPDQKGSYAQETVVYDQNFAYYLTDDGVRFTNGTQSDLLTKNVFEDMKNLPNKDMSILGIHKGRLYVWYAQAGESFISACYVININFGMVESHDTEAYVSRATVAFNDDDAFIVASSVVGQVFFQENENNDYTNLGGDINFMLSTHFMSFGTAARKKEVRYWKPRFAAQSGNYAMQCLYGYDLRTSLTTQSSPNVQGEGPIWGSSDMIWGSFTWGTTAETQSDLKIPGEYRRIKIAYRHYATRQPQRFLGHTFVVQTRRLK